MNDVPNAVSIENIMTNAVLKRNLVHFKFVSISCEEAGYCV